jgi:heme A synthase
MSTTTTPVRTTGTRSTWRTRGLAAIGAPVAALVVWAVADPLAGVNLQVGSGAAAQHVGPVMVGVISLLVSLAALGLLAVLERVTRRPRTVWLAVALFVLVLSLTGPLGAATTAATLSLAAMHLAVAAVLVGTVLVGTVLVRTTGRAPASDTPDEIPSDGQW